MSCPAGTNLSRSRQTAQGESRLNKTLAAYMLAAGAAGVGILASALPAQARVVYTPADRKIDPNVGLSLDLTNHGVTEFVFSNYYSITSSILNLSVGPVNPSNQIFSTGGNGHSIFAANIPAGLEISPDGNFKQKGSKGMANGFGTQPVCQGPWVHANERYLGLKFIINGKVHFGWARLNVDCVYPNPVNAVLTGYAYETLPDKPIVAGNTQESDASDAGTLGGLARGAAALSNRRVEQTPGEIH
jgi:hypothetical protein